MGGVSSSRSVEIDAFSRYHPHLREDYFQEMGLNASR
jgi:hypothetical protein